MKEITINVPDMQSPHCQARVSKAVNEIEGAVLQQTNPGQVSVSVATDAVKEELIKAIEKAGYSVSQE